MKKRKRTARSDGSFGSFLFGVLLSFGFLIILSLIAAIFLAGAKSPTKNLGAVSLAIFILGALISGFVNSKRKGDGGVLFSVIVSLTFSFILLVVSLVACGGKISGVHFMNCICYMLAASFAAFVGKRRERRHKRHG